MNYKSLLFLIIVFIASISCSTGPKKPAQDKKSGIEKLNRLEWLIGSWANISEEGQYYETWTNAGDSAYSAFSYMIIGGDTVFSEHVLMGLKMGELYYNVSVSNQNEGAAASFKLISIDDNEFIFENPQHDFPQRVIYKNPAPDSLYARIEGLINGEFKFEEYPMQRIK